ncbi:uncharacterized protein LOC126741547 [Anthonomus grandis grandis]|uniref:uncharacterized protein LOC126741547 n=1 Tax=Anthonomus grandis grandis TaxID=2921223 RepID=UPI002165FD68|nr:uncharacterized protein LOC126741547 [Anthonomus grandis grandis]
MSAIKDLKDVLNTKALAPTEDILDTEVSPLTAPGENYGSIMLSIRAKTKDRVTGNERVLDIVAKHVPNSEMVWKVFNIPVTFRSELRYYSDIVPTLNQFLKSHGFEEGADFAAPYYGGRLNLNNSETVDKDAVLLLKNLKEDGYRTGNKRIGLDEDSFKVTLDSLAKLHASGLALKIKEPETFREKIQPYFYTFQVGAISNMAFKNLIHTLELNGFNKEEIEKAKEAYLGQMEKSETSDVWGTITHYDTWTNNVLIRYKNSKPVHCVLVDFQTFDYRSSLTDLMFFVFGSLQQRVLETKLDEILDYYYRTFLSYLRRLGLDTKEHTPESFQAELPKAMKYSEFMHVMWMLLPIMYEKLDSVDAFRPEMADSYADYDEHLIKRIVCITRICLDKGWI